MCYFCKTYVLSVHKLLLSDNVRAYMPDINTVHVATPKCVAWLIHAVCLMVHSKSSLKILVKLSHEQLYALDSSNIGII